MTVTPLPLALDRDERQLWVGAQCLGFNLDLGNDELRLAGISRGSCRMFLANAPQRTSNKNAPPMLAWLNLESREAVDALHRSWSSRGARLVAPPESKPWGLHEFTATDLDGNLFRVFYDFGTAEQSAGGEGPQG